MITIIPCGDVTISHLLRLKDAGVPVALTSHPGNASLYKLTLWSAGIPERLWDITCAVADANNWPCHMLHDGKALPLLSPKKMYEVKEKTNATYRYVTAYLASDLLEHEGKSCGRVHVKAMQECFPSVVSPYTNALLAHQEKTLEMFEYLAATMREVSFPCTITCEGIKVPFVENGKSPPRLAEEFLRMLGELKALLAGDMPKVLHGGPCYEGAMVPLVHMLTDYWQTGETVRFDISGPDMIHYAQKVSHAEKLSMLLAHLRKWKPSLVPKNITIHMSLGTVARVGYVRGHVSEEIMRRKLMLVRDGDTLTSEQKKSLRVDGGADESL